MEFSNIGKHCEMRGCKQLDFLPFQCDRCHKSLCLEHRTYTDHHCEEKDPNNVIATICPLCEQAVGVAKGEDPNAKVEKHIIGGCRSEAKERLKKNRCSMKGCKKSELVPFHCRDCKGQFCVTHRGSHSCSKVVPKESMRQLGPFKIPIRVR